MKSTIPHPDSAPAALNCAIVTVSDTRAQQLAAGNPQPEDPGGKTLEMQLLGAGHSILHYEIIPDDIQTIQSTVQAIAANDLIQAIILTGGTGIAPRDVTYEAIHGLLDKELPGFGEIFRLLSYQQVGSRAMASRAIAGVYQSCIIFALPGSVKAVVLAMEQLVLPELIHLTQLLKSAQ
jgi:molybdopterin adenylyltransferase